MTENQAGHPPESAETSQLPQLDFSTSTTIATNPAPAVSVTVTDAGLAQDAYEATLGLAVLPPGILIECPADWGIVYHLVFSGAAGTVMAADADPNGCVLVEIVVGASSTLEADDAYWSTLTSDLSISEAEIYPYAPPSNP